MDWIEKQAVFYRNLALAKNYMAVVHLEDKEDEPFWNGQLQSVKPGRYRYLHYSKSNNGTETRGCEQCLRFRPYLTDRFFICIDSDLRLLKGEESLTAENHIAQTYAYSWENHRCEANHLCKRLRQYVETSDFDLKAFISSFSQIVYKPLLYLVHYSTDLRLNSLWNISKFNACIPLQPKRAELENNGKAYLDNMQERFENALAGLNEAPNLIPSITEENAYLHIQGHQLYKLLLHIGTLLCKGKNVAFRTDVLDKGLNIHGYAEIEALQSDLNAILNKP